MDRTKGESLKEKTVFALIHFISILTVFSILFLNKRIHILFFLKPPTIISPMISRIILFFAALLYFIRHMFTLFVFLKRKVHWDEAFFVGIYIFVIEVLFAILTVYNKRNFSYYDIIWIVFVLLGSYLNTASEYQRMVWKREKSHQGMIYSEGLFRYAMHINFFGDSFMFTGFALLTGNLWALLIPLFIILSFVFYHIPALDKYLEDKYKEQFEEYRRKTKKFIPWVY